jgi:isoquinoline 1-oxidoreductase alpha subunit
VARTLTLNGKPHTVQADGDTPLLWVLRGELGLTGTKYGCGIALCGACTVHLDGEPVRSCVTPIAAAAGRSITTIEGVEGPQIEALRTAWVALDVPQCGWCQSGQLMSACALLRATPAPDDAQIARAMNGVLCRCGAYPRIHAAIRQCAGKPPSKA